MLTNVRGGKRATATVAILFAVAVTACSSNGDVLPLPPETTSETTTPTAVTSSQTTETTLATTTTLSERELAEAEIEQVVEAWYFFPYDTSNGDEGIGVEYLTGLMLQRVRETVAGLEGEGRIQRNLVEPQLEITGVDIDLDAGYAKVPVCWGSGRGTLDAETLEVVGVDDPSYTTTGEFQLTRTDDGWKIHDLYLSRNTNDPVECEIEP